MNELPQGWAGCTFGEVAKIVAGGTPPSKDETNFAATGGVPWLTPADLSGYRSMYIKTGARNLSEKGYATCSAALMPAGSVLFSSRAPIGYVAIAENEISTNQGFKSFVLPAEIESRYTYYYLKLIKPLAEQMATGTTFKELSGSATAKLPLLIAPLPEQKRIADKLDSVLARVDACRDRLDRLPALLKRFRQSILAAATSGRLTEDWRNTGACSASWQNISLGKYVENLDGKRVPISETLRTSRRGQFPYYGASGVIDTIDGYTHDGKFLLIGEDGANLLTRSKPIAFIATGKIWVNNHAHVLKCKHGAPEEYLCYFINSIDLTPYVSGSAQPKLNQKNMNSIEVPVPPVKEQTEIVRRVEILFAFADRLEARLVTARRQVGQLTPALLAKAFRGELVAQDPADEPAAELLKRLAAQREVAPKVKRGRAKG